MWNRQDFILSLVNDSSPISYVYINGISGSPENHNKTGYVAFLWDSPDQPSLSFTFKW